MFRYGWSSETDNKIDEPPSPSTPSISGFPNEEPQNITSNRIESADCTGNQVNDCPSSENTPPDEQVKSMVCLIKYFLSLVLYLNLISLYTRNHDYFSLTRRIKQTMDLARHCFHGTMD